METIKKFIKGLFTSRRDNAPSFVLANLSFKTEQFIEWLKENTNASGYCNIDVLQGQDGKPYCKHNDWQPSGDREQFVKKEDGSLEVEEREEIRVENIPFN